MTVVLDVGKKKQDAQCEGKPPPKPPAKKKQKGRTFRLDDELLAYKLRMIAEDRDISVSDFIKPLIQDDVEIAFSELQKKLEGMTQAEREAKERRRAE